MNQTKKSIGHPLALQKILLSHFRLNCLLLLFFNHLDSFQLSSLVYDKLKELKYTSFLYVRKLPLITIYFIYFVSFVFYYFPISIMREKRERKPSKRNDLDFVQPKKRIKKTNRSKKEQQGESEKEQSPLDESVEVLDRHERGEKIPNHDKDINLSNQGSRVLNQNEGCTPSSKDNHIQSKLGNLEKLNESYQEVKAKYQQNLEKYNLYKNSMEQFSKKVNQTNCTIKKKAKQLKQLSRKIYIEAIQTNKRLFLTISTFHDSIKFTEFLTSLQSIVQATTRCPYEDPIQSLSIIKIVPQTLLINKQISVRQHKKQSVIKEHIRSFPYLTVTEQYIPLVQALLGATKLAQNEKQLPAQQFPCLFIRESGIDYENILESNSILHKLVNLKMEVIAKSIKKIIAQRYPQIQDQDYDESKVIYLLIEKGLYKLKYISYPHKDFELRGFCYRGNIFINTYYIEQQECLNLSRQIRVSYCVLTVLRQLANFIINSLLFSLNKNDEDISLTIQGIRNRTDPGSQLEKYLTIGHCFVSASSYDYRQLQQQFPSLEKLGKYSQFSYCYIFEEQRKRKNTRSTELMSKYSQNGKIIYKEKEHAFMQDREGQQQEIQQRKSCEDSDIGEKIKNNEEDNKSITSKVLCQIGNQQIRGQR